MVYGRTYAGKLSLLFGTADFMFKPGCQNGIPYMLPWQRLRILADVELTGFCNHVVSSALILDVSSVKEQMSRRLLGA